MTRDEERLQETANARQLGDTRLIDINEVTALLTEDFLCTFSDFPSFAALKAALAHAGLTVDDFETVADWNGSRVSEVLARHSGFVTFGKMVAAAILWAAEEDGHWTDGEGGSAHIWEGSGRRQ